MSGAFGQFGRRRFSARKIGFVSAAALLAGLCLAARANQNQSVALAWDPSPDTNVVGYILYYGNLSGAYTNKLDVGMITNATVSALQPGQTYYFVVTAYNAQSLESEPSNEVAFLVPGLIRLLSKSGPSSPARISFPVAPGRTYEVEATADLRSWVTILQTNCPTNCWVDFADAGAISQPKRFYRIHLLP